METIQPKRNGVPIHATILRHPENTAPDTKRHLSCGSIYLKCPEQANPQEQKAAEWLAGAREGE